MGLEVFLQNRSLTPHSTFILADRSPFQGTSFIYGFGRI